MNYEIKLYAHGVPKGQSTWGVESFDGNYIETFYGRKSNVSTQMFVEVKQFGSSTYCYYTYLRTGNVCDNSGRSGSFFALTLRINYYYADIQNIYNLLDAAFNKFIVGSIVSINGGITKYLITDFIQADTTLKTLEQELNKYLMQFSSDSDFISLRGFKANGQNEPAVVNILECDIKAIANHIKNNSSISVSPLHPSTREQRIIKKMTAEINAAQYDKEIGIQAIRNEYKEVDRTISSLRHETDKANKEIVRLNNIINDLNLKLQNTAAYKEKYDKAVKDLDSKNALLTKIHNNLSELSGILEVLELSPQPCATRRNNEQNPLKKEESNLSLMEIIRKIHPFTDFFVIIVLLVIIGVTLPKSYDTKKISHTELAISDGQGNSESNEQDTNNNTVVDDEVTADDNQESQRSLKKRFPSAKIDITEITAKKPMKYGDGSSYTLSLINVNEELDGKWESSDFAIHGNQITPKRSGQCTISYVVGDDTLVTRTIIVK